MSLHGCSFVGDKLVKGGSGSLQAASPLDGRRLAPGFSIAGAEEAAAALEAAREAFETYGRSDGAGRGAFLERIADEILALGDELILRAREETGLLEARLMGERARTCAQLRLFAQVARDCSWVDARIDTALPDRRPVAKPDLRRMLAPIGPVVVFGSSNFPLAFSVAGGDTASALATGNPVVVKAHSGHPGTSEMVATAVRRAVVACGLPAGVFSMLHGAGKVLGVALVRHPLTQAVGFTGSRAAGRALFDAAAERPQPIPVFAEMSSLNPVFLLPGALRERGKQIAEGLGASLTMGVGQLCTKPGLVFGLAGGEFEQFQEVLARALEAVAPATMLHSGICASYHKGAARASALRGVDRVGGSAEAADPAKTQAGALVLRTEVENFLEQPDLADEVFGPFAVLVVGRTMAQFEEVARGLEGQLTATLHASGDELAGAKALLGILERKAGRVILNGFPTGVEVCPSMNHGGPYPATTDVRFTSVGTAALYRFVRPICYQDFPGSLLPDALKDGNPLKISRLVNGQRSSA